MKLYATIKNERDTRPTKKGANEFLNIELSVGNKRIGDIELMLMTQDEDDETLTEVEWLLKYYVDDDSDPEIIAQGHTTKPNICYCGDSGLSVPHYKDDHEKKS